MKQIIILNLYFIIILISCKKSNTTSLPTNNFCKLTQIKYIDSINKGLFNLYYNPSGQISEYRFLSNGYVLQKFNVNYLSTGKIKSLYLTEYNSNTNLVSFQSTLTYTYNVQNNIDYITRNYVGQTTLDTFFFKYNSINQLTKIISPGSYYYRYEYFSDGNVSKCFDVNVSNNTEFLMTTYNSYGAIDNPIYELRDLFWIYQELDIMNLNIFSPKIDISQTTYYSIIGFQPLITTLLDNSGRLIEKHFRANGGSPYSSFQHYGYILQYTCF